ncbi:MAG: coiled coil domain-containing protein [Bacillota bacterium]|nr:coiled coil domain-containing protein [Bacillota bacterium]
MEDKDSYRKYLQKQLEGWVEEVKDLKKKAGAAGAEAFKNMPEQIKVLEKKIEEGTQKLKELAETNEESWESLKDGFESAWKSLSAGFKEAADKFKWEKDED